MKKTLLTALSVSMLISFTQGQTTGIQSTNGLKINTHGLKPKDSNTSKSNSGSPTAQPGGLPTGSSSSTSSATTTTAPKSGGIRNNQNGSTSTTPPTTTTSGGGGIRNNQNGGNSTTPSTTLPSNVNSSDAYNAVKSLLVTGINAAVSKVSVTDGYYANQEIKILLPNELQPVGDMLSNYGAGPLVDKLVMQLNRSAEQSATLATPIFVNSITQISPNDAVNIITGSQQDAATQFLKRTTTEQLVAAFKPQVKTVLDQTKTSTAYADVMSLYNKIPFVSPVSTDLPDYVTRKALDGLFIMVAKEEAKIRQNPAAAGSSILSKVLGAVLGQQSSLKANNNRGIR